MDNWKQAKEVDALTSGTDIPKTSNTSAGIPSLEKETFFTTEGRLRRKSYFLRVLLLSVPGAILGVVSEGPDGSGFIGLLALITIVCSILAIFQVVKRLHDIDMNGLYWLLSLVPLINIIFGLYILFKDGTVGPNKYGENPKGRTAVRI